MNVLRQDDIDVAEIVRQGLVVPHFQPLVSLRKNEVVGVEGLSRGIDPKTGWLIPAPLLFAEAVHKGLSQELDQVCHAKILADFRLLQDRHPDIILSINVDASGIDKKSWSGQIKAQVEEADLSPSAILIEIIESIVHDTEELKRFVENHREAGFLVALDDVGAGHSNLNRIPLIKPDVLKIDRYLVQDIEEDFYKEEVLKSLVSMARHLGTVLVAEGVETRDQGEALMTLGLDTIQGFYFSKPQKWQDLQFDAIQEKIDELGLFFRTDQVTRMEAKRRNMERHFSRFFEIHKELEKLESEDFCSYLQKVAGSFPSVECLYVLDAEGLQVTEMVFNGDRKPRRRSALFHPLPKGADHRNRDYYYFLMGGQLSKTSYVTKPYVSTATGTLCVTVAFLFQDRKGDRFILCLDTHTPY